jgi:hypothetical protein
MNVSKKPKKPKPGKPPGPNWPKLLRGLRVSWGEPGEPLTQKAAAARLGVSLRSWASWELGDRPPTKPIGKLIRLLSARPDADMQ